MADLRLITGLYDKARKWRRFRLTQNLPVVGLGHGLLATRYAGAAQFLFGLQVSTINYSTRSVRWTPSSRQFFEGF